MRKKITYFILISTCLILVFLESRNPIGFIEGTWKDCDSSRTIRIRKLNFLLFSKYLIHFPDYYGYDLAIKSVKRHGNTFDLEVSVFANLSTPPNLLENNELTIVIDPIQDRLSMDGRWYCRLSKPKAHLNFHGEIAEIQVNYQVEQMKLGQLNSKHTFLHFAFTIECGAEKCVARDIVCDGYQWLAPKTWKEGETGPRKEEFPPVAQTDVPIPVELVKQLKNSFTYTQPIYYSGMSKPSLTDVSLVVSTTQNDTIEVHSQTQNYNLAPWYFKSNSGWYISETSEFPQAFFELVNAVPLCTEEIITGP